MGKAFSQTYVQASARLDDACAWLDRLGINYSPTRIGRYKALFSALARHQLAGTLADFEQEYSGTTFVNLAHEAAEVVRIFEGLRHMDSEQLKSRLLKVLKGHELYVHDREDRSGRDFSLELVIASKFARAGFDIDFGHQADLRSKLAEHPIFVECKRLKSASQVEKRIKGGLRQLHARYEASDSPPLARGLLVLSTAKLFNANLGYIEANDVVDLNRKMEAFNSAFINLNRHLWQTRPDTRTLGVVIGACQ